MKAPMKEKSKKGVNLSTKFMGERTIHGSTKTYSGRELKTG